jgi:hypothetical protein
VTAWLLLRRVLGDGWLALPGAFVALTLSAGLGSGVEGGVHRGMVPARLAWALLPLLAQSLCRWIDGERGFPRTTAPLVAAVVLIHPAHLPAAVVLVLVAVWLARSHRGLAWGHAVAALGLAAGLSAFWTVPLIAHVDHVRALAWGALTAREIFGHPLAVALIVLAALDLPRWWGRRVERRRSAALLATFPWAMTAVVLGDLGVLEPLGLRWLPADRVADSAWLAFVLSAGAVAGRLLAAAARDRARARPAAAVAAVVVVILVSLPTRALTLLPPLVGWERYQTIERGLRLDALWTTLRAAPPGRVLFVRSGVPLVYGPEWWRPHSHVTALTPLAAAREIVNGTFTHPSPVAAFVYRGDAGGGAIRELVERLDGRRLFGRDLDALDPATFNGYADRLGVSTVVALDEDLPRLRALRDNPQFVRLASGTPFVVYVSGTAPALPRETTPGHLRLAAGAPRDSWISTRIAHYPLWKAASDGHPLPTRRGEAGDLEVRSARPGAEIDLVYRRGPAEAWGLAITAASAILLAVLTGARRGRP